MGKIMISLVMATYNGEKFLREQLDSIYHQTMLPDEVIVVDDGSKDRTVQILSEYAIQYGLKYVLNEVNSGINATFEKAISQATGEYICISDQDDVWFPTKIEISVKKLKEIEKSSPACVSSNSTVVDERLRVVHKHKGVFLKECYHSQFLYGNGSQGCTLFFNKKMKEVIIPLSNNYIYDHYIGILSYFVGERYFIKDSLMFYRCHGRNEIGRITKYHKWLSESIGIYQIMIRKERLGILREIVDEKKENISVLKTKELNELIEYYNVNDNFQMVCHVVKNRYIPLMIKIIFSLLVLFLKYNKKYRMKFSK